MIFLNCISNLNVKCYKRLIKDSLKYDFQNLIVFKVFKNGLIKNWYFPNVYKIK
jgi:hypothetical protein